MTFEEYFEWEEKNVIHLESNPRIIENSWRMRSTSWESAQKTKKTTATHCPHCGAPVNPYEEKCDYCDCYY